MVTLELTSDGVEGYPPSDGESDHVVVLKKLS